MSMLYRALVLVQALMNVVSMCEHVSISINKLLHPCHLCSCASTYSIIISYLQEVDLSLVTSLDALSSVHQVHGLSVKQLKLILQQNCINYKGCVEKDELQVRVRRLWQAKRMRGSRWLL